MQWQRALKETRKAIGAALIVFLCLEVVLRVVYHVRNAAVEYIPLPYVVGDDYGPMPPWIDQFRILEADDALIWKNRANVHRTYVDVFAPVQSEDDRVSLLRQFIPSMPASLRGSPVWDISINSRGFRDREFLQEKPASVFRILCLGDSWTFGANVDQEHTYPQQLEKMLAYEFPSSRVEVINLGVLGYSSFQGLELLKTTAVGLDPDLVIIGFTMNDASIAGFRDKDMPQLSRQQSIRGVVNRVLDHVEIYKLLRYVAQVLNREPASMDDRIRAMAERATHAGEVWWSNEAAERAQYDSLEQWTRVSPGDFTRNIREMITVARDNDIGVILLYNQLWASQYRPLLRRVAGEMDVPLIDSQALIDSARKTIAVELDQALGLTPETSASRHTGDEVEVVFRVYLADRPVPSAVYITGAHPQLGNLVPNTIRMHDDGTRGDQRAGDAVWSYSARLERGASIFYVYTNSGTEGKWEGLDIPDVRRFRVDSASTRAVDYRPVERFGELTLQADSWHTNAEGYRLIAAALVERLKAEERFLRHVQP
jgi:lysophospholipase L1-like esterase